MKDEGFDGSAADLLDASIDADEEATATKRFEAGITSYFPIVLRNELPDSAAATHLADTSVFFWYSPHNN
eukprot:2457012-Pyramimonas_sp.AAC.1